MPVAAPASLLLLLHLHVLAEHLAVVVKRPLVVRDAPVRLLPGSVLHQPLQEVGVHGLARAPEVGPAVDGGVDAAVLVELPEARVLVVEALLVVLRGCGDGGLVPPRLGRAVLELLVHAVVVPRDGVGLLARGRHVVAHGLELALRVLAVL